jgi:hypothetical protein
MIDEVFASSPVPRFTADKKTLVATNGYAYLAIGLSQQESGLIAYYQLQSVDSYTMPKRDPERSSQRPIYRAKQWSGAPAETRSFVLIVEDPDAPSGVFRNRAIYDLPPNTPHYRKLSVKGRCPCAWSKELMTSALHVTTARAHPLAMARTTIIFG